MSKRTIAIAVGLVVGIIGALVWWHGRTPSGGKSGGVVVGAGTAGGKVHPSTSGATGVDVVVRTGDKPGLVGSAVKDAVVRIAGPSGGVVEPRVTGMDGRTSFDVPPGRYRLTAASGTQLPAEATVEVPPAGRAEANLQLGDAAPVLHGQVSDFNGGPIAGAIVTVAAEPGGLGADTDRAVAAITDAKGEFAVGVTADRYEVRTVHPEYLPDTRAIYVGASGAEIQIKLAPGAQIEGVVLDAGRAPVGGATVSYSREVVQRGPLGRGRAEHGTVTAGADGTFQITGLGAGRITLDAETADGRATKEPTEVEVGIAETVTGVELSVATAPMLVGKVVHDDGTPASGAEVMVESTTDINMIDADATGTFRVVGIRPGSYTLSASAADALDSAPTTIQVTAAAIPPVTLKLKAGAFITGRVEPPGPADISQGARKDEPAPDDVGIGLMRLATGATTVRTEPDGRFRIGPFQPGEITLEARAADGRKGSAAVVVPAKGDVVITLEERGSIAGRVVDPTGAPVIGAVVNVHPHGATNRTMVVNGLETSADRAPVDAAGGFRIAGRDAGAWDLTVLDARGGRLPFAKTRAEDEPVRVSLTKGEHKEGVELVVEAATGSIRGSVVDAAGAPVADAWVTVTEDGGGIPGLPPGMRMRGAGGGGPGGGAGPGRGGPPPAARGHDDPAPDGGEETDETQMIVVSGNQPMAGDIPPVLTGPDGKFSIGGLKRGAYEVTAEGLRGGARGTVGDIKVDHDPVDVTVKVVSLATIKGVVTSGGKPVTDFEISAEGPSMKSRKIHADDGSFMLRSLDAGHYKVTAHDAAGTGTTTVDVAAGQTAQATIEIVGDARVTGTLVDAAGAPQADRVVLLIPRQAEGQMMVTMTGPPQRTGPDGRFTATAPGGPRTLIVMGGRGPELTRDLDLAPGQVMDIGTVKLEPARPPGSGGPHKEG